MPCGLVPLHGDHRLQHCDGSALILVGHREERLTELSRQIEKDGASAEVIVADLGTPHELAAVEGPAAAGDLTTLINANLVAIRLSASAWGGRCKMARPPSRRRAHSSRFWRIASRRRRVCVKGIFACRTTGIFAVRSLEFEIFQRAFAFGWEPSRQLQSNLTFKARVPRLHRHDRRDRTHRKRLIFQKT
jgi:hypothetical protein